MRVDYVFADEAGCFTFKNQRGASRYFVLCTITMAECDVANDLIKIRRDLAASGEPERTKLHATTDAQLVRDRVFEVLGASSFRVDATVLEKCKAHPQCRVDEPTFYKYAWHHHFKDLNPQLLSSADKLLITAAALGSKKTKAAFKLGVNNTIQELVPRDRWEVSFIDSANDPLLWAADYCAWAIQRKWELGDERSFKLISDKIATNKDLWEASSTRYY